jgi:two-component system C4-dicarboxylate transport sensor histidine kinase DctB
LLFWCGTLAFVGGVTFQFQYLWREQGLRSLQELNTQRVQLLTTSLDAEINRQDHLPLLLSLDHDVRAALKSQSPTSSVDELNRKLRRISIEADTRGIYLVRPDGTVLASGDDDAGASSIVGRNVADRSYFRHAIAKGKSAELGVEPDTGRVRYFLAEAVREGAVLGVVVVRVEFDALESAWGRAGERVIVTDQAGVAFLASDAVFKFRRMVIANDRDTTLPRPDYYRQDAQPISWEFLGRRGSASIVRAVNPADGTSYMYESMSLPEYGWTVHRLADLETVNRDQRDGAIIGGAISTLLVLMLLYTRQRHRAYLSVRQAGARLQHEVDERTRELQGANRSLLAEVDERRRTEAQLRSTQNELVQAGKLAALGQMSAALAHEINQPLAAIQTFIASSKILTKRGDLAQTTRNLDLISSLVERMAKLTAHLKTFARKSEPGHSEPVLVDRAVEGALFLVESRIRAGSVKIEKDLQRDLRVTGHAVQLEQVIVNLLLNALDAIAGISKPEIRIAVAGSDTSVVVRISDNGVGIPAKLIDRIFDPFVTSKPVGKGLGLGLSISYGIVQGFSGRIHAINRPEGGAEVIVELPRLLQANVVTIEASHA